MSITKNQSDITSGKGMQTKWKYMLLCLGLLLLSIQAYSQQTPTGHAAIWQNVKNSWSMWAERDLDGYMEYHHAGYSGWFHDSPTHRGKKVTRQLLEDQFQRLEVIFYEANLIDIKIHNNAAIVHYYISYIVRDSHEKDYKRTFRRTDFLNQTEEKWQLIAHHGNLVE
ncbi:MAG: nuclear transport factor 2 family protein [Cyclobacteriaceae bacterium]